MYFLKLWLGLLVGVAADLPDLSRILCCDVRLGDILTGLLEGESVGLIAYDLGKEIKDKVSSKYCVTGTFSLIRNVLSDRQTAALTKLESLDNRNLFLPFYENIKHQTHGSGTVC